MEIINTSPADISFAKEQFTAALTCQKRGDHGGAIARLRRCLPAYEPRADVYFHLAFSHQLQGNLEDAVRWYICALEDSPKNKIATFNLGAAYADLGLLDKAEAMFQRAISLDSHYQDPVAALAALYERHNRLEDARTLLTPLLEKGTQNLNCLLIMSRIERRLGLSPGCEASLLNLLPRISTPKAREAILFELAAISDHKGNHRLAYGRYYDANTACEHAYSRSDAEKATRYVTSLFPREDLPPTGYRTDKNLLLIVGMPRSGTTLTHEIVSAHPDAFGAGETRFLDALFHGLPRMLGFGETQHHEALQKVTDSHRKQWFAEYMSFIGAPDGATTVVEKMPLNLYHLGLIEFLWPSSKVIFCLRDPRDIALSCYFHAFSTGHDFSYDLDAIFHFQDQQRRLLDHWRGALELPLYLNSYRKLVDHSPEAVTDLLTYAGLSRHDNCFNHFTLPRNSYTASYDRANAPISKQTDYAPYFDLVQFPDIYPAPPFAETYWLS